MSRIPFVMQVRQPNGLAELVQRRLDDPEGFTISFELQDGTKIEDRAITQVCGDFIAVVTGYDKALQQETVRWYNVNSMTWLEILE